jgi:Fe-S cluster assembly scaffold protein SufB
MTTSEMNTTTTFGQEWAARAAKRGAENGEPAWAASRRQVGLAHACALGFPKRNDELWRRTDFRAVENGIASLDAFSVHPRARNVEDLPVMVQERLAGEKGSTALVVQRDAGVTFEQTHPELEKQGVIVCSMERGLKEHASRLEGVMGASLEPDYDWYASLAQAIRSGGTFVYVPDNTEAAVPMHIFQTIEGAGRLTAPHSVILIGRNSRATVVEEQMSEHFDGLSVHMGATASGLEP